MPDVALLAVDAANVVGSRPDGWWRDPLAATRRLRDRLHRLGETGLADLRPPVEVVLIVEGAARDTEDVPGVRVVRSPGSGDDALVELVRAAVAEGRPCVAITADRNLRDRVRALGARVHGPAWLLGQLAER